jgi:hypothetical protein
MAPNYRKLFKREAPQEEPAAQEDYPEEPEQKETTLATQIFGKHLHKVRATTVKSTTEAEGKCNFAKKDLAHSIIFTLFE